MFPSASKMTSCRRAAASFRKQNVKETNADAHQFREHEKERHADHKRRASLLHAPELARCDVFHRASGAGPRGGKARPHLPPVREEGRARHRRDEVVAEDRAEGARDHRGVQARERAVAHARRAERVQPHVCARAEQRAELEREQLRKNITIKESTSSREQARRNGRASSCNRVKRRADGEG